jgi:hypothetical protein
MALLLLLLAADIVSTCSLTCNPNGMPLHSLHAQDTDSDTYIQLPYHTVIWR